MRLGPSLCILATVSLPGQAQIAPDDGRTNTAERGLALPTVDPLAEADPSIQVRAPMLEPEEAGGGELELVEPSSVGGRWSERAVRVRARDKPGSQVSNDQDLTNRSVAALSATPSTAAPSAEAEARDVAPQWPKYGLVASLMVAAIVLFWRLGDRARLSNQGLIGYQGSIRGEEGVPAANAGLQGSAPADQSGPALHGSLKDAVSAMKAAPRDGRP